LYMVSRVPTLSTLNAEITEFIYTR